ILLFFGFTPPVHAGIYNAVEILVGEKAAGMGGAFTAVADDPSAAYYNPAGIVQIPFASMSASANVAHFKTREGKFFLQDDEKLTSFDFIPDFWGATTTTFLGKVGFSIVIPESDDFEFHQKYTDVPLMGFTWNTARDDVTFEADTYLIGPTYAFSIVPGLSAGVSLYFLYNTFDETGYRYWDTDYPDATDGVNHSLQWEDSRGVDGTGTGITGKAGLLWRAGETFRVGAAFRPPARIDEEVEVRQVTYLSDIREDNLVTGFDRGNVEADLAYTREVPHAATLGVAFLPSKRFTLAMDLSYYGPVEFQEKTATLDGNFQPVEVSRTVTLKEVVNGSVGMEYFLTPRIPLRAGIFSDRSAAPEVQAINSAQPTKIDKYGATLSSGYLTANSTLVVGVKYAYGEGEGTAADYSDTSIGFSYQKETYTQTETAFFISGTYMF
ncbi:MAG: outer membrane protein transport protein, partial [Nitrospirae bacterium]|nr:outer membrane protein transport protein [Nitrospirota bacterium]